jgi:hypothetical protein
LTGGTANVSGSFSYGTGTNAGSYSAYWIFNPSDTTNYYAVDGYVTATIAKASCSSLSVAAVNSTYNGSSQNLLSVGGNCGTMYYRVNSGSWTTTMPTSTNVGSWTIYCYMAESTNYNGWYSQSSPASYSCSISCANPTITQTPYNRGVTYNGSAQYLLTGGTANVSGSFSYSTGTNAGSYTATWTFTPSSSNYCTVNGSVAASIARAAGSVTINGVSLTYNGNYQNLATVSGPTGTMHYSTDYSSWSTSIPTSLNVGSWTIYWYMDASTNYEGIGASTGRYVSSSMGCLAQSAPTAYGSTTTYPSTATATASGGGGVGSLEWESAQSQSSVGSHTTRARWFGNGNYCPSPWSNYVTVQMNKADQAAPTATGASVWQGSTATATASGGGGQGSLEWSNGNTRTAIGSQTTQARWSGNGNYNASSWSNSVTLTVNDPYAGHAYVEIAGLKWATMNIGANNITDYGLYFQWGDTAGYTASQVGSGSGQKYFGWADYKYGNPDDTGITKYNSTDGKTVLDLSDDAARANWGGAWRMPTTAEFQALGNAVNATWTASYQGSGVAGLVCTDKTDSSKVLFFPAAGYCGSGSMRTVGGGCWSSSLNNVRNACYLFFISRNSSWGYRNSRYYGFPVRGGID